MDTDCGVYALLNLATGMVYVGSSVHIYKRHRNHLAYLRAGTHCNALLQAAWQQHADAFAAGVLEWCAPGDVRQRERYWIGELQAADHEYGYNTQSTCNEPVTFPAETRARMSAANRRRPVTPETRATLREANRNHSPETRAKIGAASRNRSPETRAKLSAAARNRSPETQAKLNAARQHQDPATLSRPCSPETRAKIAAANKAAWARKRLETAL